MFDSKIMKLYCLRIRSNIPAMTAAILISEYFSTSLSKVFSTCQGGEQVAPNKPEIAIQDLEGSFSNVPNIVEAWPNVGRGGGCKEDIISGNGTKKKNSPQISSEPRGSNAGNAEFFHKSPFSPESRRVSMFRGPGVFVFVFSLFFDDTEKQMNSKFESMIYLLSINYVDRESVRVKQKKTTVVFDSKLCKNVINLKFNNSVKIWLHLIFVLRFDGWKTLTN